MAVGGVGGSKVAVGGLVISCSHCEVDGRWGRLLEGGLLCCVGVVIDGCARLLPGKLQSKNPAVKDFCWWDLDGVLSVCRRRRAVVDGSLDLAARVTSFFI